MSDIVLMADPRVAAIDVAECDEPLVDLAGVLRIDERKADAAGHWRLARSGVAERLSSVELPPGVHLMLVEAYRPLHLQRHYFESYRAELARARPEASAADLDALASRHISPPHLAPHTAGAAVDVTLCDDDGVELDLGTRMNATPEDSAHACYTDAPNISGAARANRRLLVDALAAVGLLNYPTEWWHFSHGDRYWAMLTGAATARYGPLPEPPGASTIPYGTLRRDGYSLTQVIYSVVDGFRPLTLDLYLPEGVSNPPVVLWVHGGGFEEGARHWLPDTLPADGVYRGLVDAGIACAAVDYRLGGEARWPAQHEDVAAAIDFLGAHGTLLGVDRSRIGVWGESAGGQLALSAAFRVPRVRAAVGWYPLTDLTGGALGNLPHLPWLGGVPAELPEASADASPITHAHPDAPPCLLVHGDADTALPVSQSEALHARLTELGAPSTLHVVPGAEHCFRGHDIGALLARSIAHLREHLG